MFGELRQSVEIVARQLAGELRLLQLEECDLGNVGKISSVEGDCPPQQTSASVRATVRAAASPAVRQVAAS